MAEPFEYHEQGFGMTQFANGDVALVGGSRTGKSGTAGTSRLRYAIYDQAEIARGTPPALAEVGHAEINLRFPADGGEPAIEGIVDLLVKTKLRGMGIGRRVAEALAASSPEGLKVYDIKRSAVPFWRKMGCQVEKGVLRPGYFDGAFPAPGPEPGNAPRP